ncbi:hypothetical protein [Caballeronia concitans]|uniref:Uncharacterized protein n=1 Tax=Caballeronia concitans TaxID=1777133 RepID=A0A658R4D4_9BURK|nr:hypothetical protein [Caballeronia concitans]SAL49376.1 hypothetical protein AWB72_05161 [Caballeronia concitans]
MPRKIEYIDAIARRKQRDVLLLTFFDDPSGDPSPHEWEEHPTRLAVVGWLDAHGYAWSPCGEVANERVMRSYRGSIYIDLPYCPDDASYRAVEEFLEYPDGTLRMPHMRFLLEDLESAQANAHHDEPGFWERWAEDF